MMQEKTLLVNNKKYFYYAVLFGAIGLIASDTYIPSMTSIAQNFHVSISFIQSSVAVFMLGFCLARFGISVLSDGLGRKAMFILCFALLTIGSCVCLFSSNVHLFILGRLLQGIGAGGSNVLARVIIRDVTDNHDLAKFNSLYSMYAVTLMVSAPFIGSVLQTYFDWHASFILLAVLSVIALLLSAFSYQETNQHKDMEHLKPKKIKSNLIALLKGAGSLRYAGLLFASFGFMTAWLTSGSIILQDKLHLTYMQFGYCALFVGVFYFTASFLSTRYVKKVGENSLIFLGVKLLIFPPIILSCALYFENSEMMIIVFSVAMGFFSAGLIIPNAYSLGVKSFSKIAGTAGAFFGFAQMFGGCVYSFVISCLSSYSFFPLLGIMLVTIIISLFGCEPEQNCDVLRVEK